MKPRGRHWLIAGGLCSFGIAILHIAIILIGPPAYRYFGAGEQMAQMASSDSALPALITLSLALIFAIWGSYAFSGAGVIRRLPLLRLGLVLIASIYTLRGIGVLFQLAAMIRLPNSVSLSEVTFSLVSLLIGVLYFMGTISSWREL